MLVSNALIGGSLKEREIVGEAIAVVGVTDDWFGG